MSDNSVLKLSQPSTFSDPLTEVLRSGARSLLARAVEAEVAAFLDGHSEARTEEGRRRLVRHGHLPEREIMTGIGPVAVRAPRVRDRTGQGADRIRFSSALLPPYARRSKSLEVLIPALYLKGISTGDFAEALAALLGPDAGGLSAVVKRVSSPPIGALTDCFSAIRGGQFSALNNTVGLQGRKIARLATRAESLALPRANFTKDPERQAGKADEDDQAHAYLAASDGAVERVLRGCCPAHTQSGARRSGRGRRTLGAPGGVEGTLGNLTLTAFNPEMGNRPFRDKRDAEKGYRDSPPQLNADLRQTDRWDGDSIRARGARLADEAVGIWKRPVLPDRVLEPYRTPRAGAGHYTLN